MATFSCVSWKTEKNQMKDKNNIKKHLERERGLRGISKENKNY